MRNFSTRVLLVVTSTAFILICLVGVVLNADRQMQQADAMIEAAHHLQHEIEALSTLQPQILNGLQTGADVAPLQAQTKVMIDEARKNLRVLSTTTGVDARLFPVLNRFHSNTNGNLGLDGRIRKVLQDISTIGTALQTDSGAVKALGSNTGEDRSDSNDIRDMAKNVEAYAHANVLPGIDKLADDLRDATSIARADWLNAEIGLLATGLLLLAFQFVFVFKPLGRALQSVIAKLQEDALRLIHRKEELERESVRYELALSGTHFGLWDWDLRTNAMHWSPHLRAMLGVRDDDFHGKIYDLENRIVQDDVQGVMGLARQHLESGVPFDVEFRMRGDDGQTLWIHARGQAIWDAAGKAVRMAGSMEDISDKKRTRMRSDLFIAGMEASPLCIAIIDMNDVARRFTYVSPALAKMTGFSQEKLLNGNVNMLIGPDTEMGDLDAMDAAMKDGRELTIEVLCYKLDGIAFKNKLQLTPVFDEGGKLRAYVTLHHDMTADIAREQHEVNRQRMESLGTLASNVAHEINNLLVPMIMAKDIIEPDIKDEADPYTREHLDQIVAYAEQAKEIVKGILTFTRREVETRTVVSLKQALDEAIDFVSGLVRTHMKIQYTPSDDIDVPALINRTEFRQIMTNFVSNAEYAMREIDEPTLRIQAQSKKLSNRERHALDILNADQIEITVSDNGTGIPKDVINRIFEPLFTTKPIGEGTGLGLSVVHGILRSWGGGITVNSIESQGTTFKLYIPVYLDHDDLNLYADLLDELNNAD